MKLGRNKSCWCGSGFKYKTCHLGRTEQPPVSAWDASKRMRKIFSRKLCAVPTKLDKPCSNRIIQAHTISVSSSLKHIARNGHVYGVSLSMDTLMKNGGRPEPRLIGIRDASTFYGFCEYHDRILFSEIENKPFICTKEQLFIIGYRAVCREWYMKKAEQKNTALLRKAADAGKSVAEQVAIQSSISPYIRGVHHGSSDADLYKSKFDDMLFSKNYDMICFCCFELDRPPDIMVTGGVHQSLTLADDLCRILPI